MWKRLSRPARAFVIVVLAGGATLMATLATTLIGVVSSPRSRQTGRLLGFESFARVASVLGVIGLVLTIGGLIGLKSPAAYRVGDDGTTVSLRKIQAEALARRAEVGRHRDWPKDRRSGFWAIQASIVADVGGLFLLMLGMLGARRHIDTGRVVTLLSPIVVVGVVALAAGVALSVRLFRLFRRATTATVSAVVVPKSSAGAVLTFVVVAALLGTGLAVVDSYATSRASRADRLSEAFVSPPAGFVEVPPRGPEDGPQDEAEVAGLFSSQAEALELLRSAGFVTGWSRHWTSGGVDNDSLVMRVYAFASPDGAHTFAFPEGCCAPSPSETSTTIVSIADARITSSFDSSIPSSYGYLALPYRILGIGRVCDLVITVFFRSRSDVHTASEVSDLLTREGERVRPISRC